MSQVCGDCARYRKMPFCEDICILTGKIVPYLAQRECFVAKVEQDTNLLNQDTNKMAENANTKVCKVCGKELPIDQFRPNPKCKDGHLDTCYECLNKKIKEAKKKKKEDESLGKIFGKDAVEQADKVFPVTQDKWDRLQEYTAQELVEYLRFQGWEVTCTRTINL